MTAQIDLTLRAHVATPAVATPGVSVIAGPRFAVRASLVCMALLIAATASAADQVANPPTPRSTRSPAGSTSKGNAAKPTRAPNSAAPSLDDQLLRDLDNELLEGIDTGGTAKPAARRPRQDRDIQHGGDHRPGGDKVGGDKVGGDKVGGGEEADGGEDVGKSAEDPLMHIGRDMRRAERLIAERDSAQPTEQLQEQIIDQLTKLIDELEKQAAAKSSSNQKKPSLGSAREQVKQPQKGGRNSSGENSPKPARESSERLGKDELRRADMEQMRGLMKDLWGQLPAKAREQMLQSPPERFLPKYELLLERYYKRLAEEPTDQR